jgi:hypothetical protein
LLRKYDMNQSGFSVEVCGAASAVIPTTASGVLDTSHPGNIHEAFA